jgi:hypothetical protein
LNVPSFPLTANQAAELVFRKLNTAGQIQDAGKPLGEKKPIPVRRIPVTRRSTNEKIQNDRGTIVLNMIKNLMNFT